MVIGCSSSKKKKKKNPSPAKKELRASSYEPGRPGWFGFRDLASPLFFQPKFRCVHMRRRAGPVTEISVTELEIFSHMNTPARIPRDCSGRNIFSCAWLVRSLTSRNTIPRVFWGPFRHFSSRQPGLNFPYEQKTKFVPLTGPARLPGSYEDALRNYSPFVCANST